MCVFWPRVKGELLLDMRYQSLVFTSMMSPPYPRSQLYYSSGSPGGLAREVSDEAVVSRMLDSVAAAGGQFHNLGTFPPRHHRHRGRSADLCLSLNLDAGQMALTWWVRFKLVYKCDM